MRTKKRPLLATKKIVLSFFILIVIGSVLLSLPIANKVEPQPYINNLFVATSCVCVTGLTPFVILDQYTLFGQIVMIILIQIGGLGFITFLYYFINKLRRKLSINSELVFKEALNQDDFSKLPRLLKMIFHYTASFELVGGLLLSLVFIPEYGFLKGLYYGIWHSISAFCNAGFDLLGGNSLMNYVTNPFMNIVIMVLIIAGGLGFIVALDIKDKYKKCKKHSIKSVIEHLSLHSKIVLLMTIVLIVSGTLLILGFEFNNPNTLGSYSLPNKILIAMFQSVTLRTAGFATVPIAGLRTITKLLMCIYMFIGGSPASTAGGIKTVTFALVMLTIINVFKGNEETYVFDRRIKKRLFLKAFTLFSIGITLCLIGTMALSATETGLSLPDIFVEIFSAFGTVGLTADVTPNLSFAGKCVDIVLMFIGRISPMSFTIFFARKAHKKSTISYPDEDVIIG